MIKPIESSAPRKSGWDVKQYEKFSDERKQPFFDLLELIQPKDNMRILDLGCGTGELTKIAHEKLGARETIGVDSSETMLEKSRQFSSNAIHFIHGDISNLNMTGHFDLIISNAAFHWVPDHELLFSRLMSLLAADGQVAIQISTNHDQPSHKLAFDMANRRPFKDFLNGFQLKQSVLPIEDYARILYNCGFKRQIVREQVYPYILDTRDEVVEWIKGTWLTAYKERLSSAEYEALLSAYQNELMSLLPDEKPFFFPFKRTFLWGSMK